MRPSIATKQCYLTMRSNNANQQCLCRFGTSYSNRQKKLSISLSFPNPRFEPKMECGPFARECCNLCPYWRAHCVLLDAGMRVRGGIRQVHSVVMVQARADGSPLHAQHTVCMHVQTGNTGAATVHTHRTYSVQHSTLAIATRNAQQSAAARAHWQHTIDNTA